MAKKFKIIVAWNQEAARILSEKGSRSLRRSKNPDLVWEIAEFDTEAERDAYSRGIADAAGWDDPASEYLDK